MMSDRHPVEMIVVALCADYGRRVDEIAKKELALKEEKSNV